MARKKMPWFRWYAETVTDPKIRRLDVAHRWLWATVLTAAATSPVPGVLLISDTIAVTDQDLADLAALPISKVRTGLKAMAEVGLIERPLGEERYPAGTWTVPKWDQRQYASDSSTDRVRAHRNRSSNAGRNDDETLQGRSRNGHGNAPETETETDTPEPPRVTPGSDAKEPGQKATAPVTRAQLVQHAITIAAERELARAPGDTTITPQRALAGIRQRLDRDHRATLTETAFRNPSWSAERLAQSLLPVQAQTVPASESDAIKRATRQPTPIDPELVTDDDHGGVTVPDPRHQEHQHT